MAGPSGNPIKTYQGQADSAVLLGFGSTTFFNYSLGPLLNTHKVATIEAYALVYDLGQFATSAGWIHYIAPLNTSIAFDPGTFSNSPPILRPNLPGSATPPADNGVLSVNIGTAGPNFAYLTEFFYDPSVSAIYARAENIISGAPQPISWKINWKLTCF
jgi:hypothetical protein